MSALLFGILTGPTLESVENLLLTPPPIDGVEIRLDYFKHIDMAALQSFLRWSRLPVMLTVRRNDQGGQFLGREEERLSLLESLCALKPAYIDLEYDVPSDFRKRLFDAHPDILFLSSYHDFSGTPDDLEEVYRKIKTPHAHIYKLAVTAHSSTDALKLLLFVQAHSDSEKIIGISMGEEGKPSRILAPVVGSYLTYAMLSSDASTAPGQFTAQELEETYRFHKLNRQTHIYALIGDPITKSLGAVVHNSVFEECGVNAVYIKALVKPEELPSFLSLAKELPFKGFSVTMPLKETVMPLLQQQSLMTRVIGACNTISLTDGQMIGYNTDGVGAVVALERREPIYGKHIVVIGAGGAAKALIFEAAQKGAFLTILNRTPDKALEMAETLRCNSGGFDLLPQVCKSGYDIIVNCIPDADFIQEEWILPEKIAMDMIYIPKNTPFLIKAMQKKCHLIFGYEMFVGQALEQQRLWFPTQFDENKIHGIIEAKVISSLEGN